MILDSKLLIGETTAFDKKRMLGVRQPKSWLKRVSAFANGEGGTLIFGISDDDQILGLLIVFQVFFRISCYLCPR